MSLPFALTGVAADIARNPDAAYGRLVVPSAVDNMSPRHPFIRGLQAIPVAPSVTVNSIIAVEGDGPVEQGRRRRGQVLERPHRRRSSPSWSCSVEPFHPGESRAPSRRCAASSGSTWA